MLSIVRERPVELALADVEAPEIVPDLFETTALPANLLEPEPTANEPPRAFGAVPPLPTSPVPEPATWISMILGLGFVGAAMRRRATVSSRARRPVEAEAGAADVG